MSRYQRGLFILIFLTFLCLVKAEISECTSAVEIPTDCPGCCPLEEATITLTEWVTSTSRCFQTTVVTTTPTKLIRSTVVQAFFTTLTTTALFTVTTSFITTITTTELDTIFLPSTRTFTRTTTVIGSATVTTKIVISATTTFTTTTSTLLERATQTNFSSRSTDLTITIPLTTTSTLRQTLVSLVVADTVFTSLLVGYVEVTVSRDISTVTSIRLIQPGVFESAVRPVYITAAVNVAQFFTDTNASVTFWSQTSSVFWTATTETALGPTTQTYSRIYGP